MNPTLSEDVPLAGLTTLEVGGPARWLARAGDPAAVYRCIELARDKGVPFVVLGGGSNVVVADAGFPGIVIQPTDQACKVEESGEDARVEAGAGLDWDRFVDTMVGRGLAGVECLSGIPGRVGAVPIQNVGAYGQEVADTIDSVTALDAATGDIVTLANAECGFGNRTSRFKAASRERHIVLRVAFRLSRRGPAAARYDELRRRLAADYGSDPGLAEIRRTVIAIRRGKSMVLDPLDENRRSVGSFFVNPVIPSATLDRLQCRAAEIAPGIAMPAFPAGPDRVKLSAAWLIEQAGFRRGHSRGAVGLSTRHALAIVNKGGASASGIVAFAAQIRRGVFDAFGVRLEPEAVFVGFDRPPDALLEP